MHRIRSHPTMHTQHKLHHRTIQEIFQTGQCAKLFLTYPKFQQFLITKKDTFHQTLMHYSQNHPRIYFQPKVPQCKLCFKTWSSTSNHHINTIINLWQICKHIACFSILNTCTLWKYMRGTHFPSLSYSSIPVSCLTWVCSAHTNLISNTLSHFS